MRNKRERLRIFYEILDFCKKPMVKTRIMNKCNLNYSDLQEFLKLLVSSNLLESSDGENGKVYQTTTKGCRFIQSYKELERLLFYEIGSSDGNHHLQGGQRDSLL